MSMDIGTTTSGAPIPPVPIPFGVGEGGEVRGERYFSPEFAAWEDDKLWRHCWQMACLEEEIPEPGDFTEYEIRGRSILVVRQDDGSVKAFVNACRHRATTLAEGSGEFPGGQIVCPFHGWQWGLDGTNTRVFAENGFEPACLTPERTGLSELRTETALGMVWVNPDPGGPSFADTVGRAVPVFSEIALERMRVRWWRHAVLPANWKLAQEAFMEAYHVGQAHPSLNMGATSADYNDTTQWEVLPGGSAYMSVPALPAPEGMTPAEYFRRYNWAMYHGTGAYPTEREMFIQRGLQHKGIPDEHFIEAFFTELYTYAATAGIDLPASANGLYAYGHIFPNITILAQYGAAIMYRSRPLGDGSERCLYEVWALQIPAADEHPDRPELEGPVDPQDWPTILREDFANILGQQKGVRSGTEGGLLFSERYELMILNHHRELDRYLRDH
jgi:phenylpropionate dioxygenase-like ring-hydroxylating dioxygenase large terminal subunit